MGTKICMNVSCGTSNTHEWKTGWPLRSGGFAHLCYKCGAAYEKSVFCDTFHIGETGWRDCSSCHKPLHCGCVASRSLYECLDYGGVGCLGCANSSQPRVIQSNDVLNGFGGLTLSNVGERKSTSVEYRAVGDTVDEGKYLQLCGTVDEGKLLQLCKIMEANQSNLLPESPKGGENTFLESNLFRPQTVDKSDSLGQTNGQEIIHQIAVNPGYFSATQSSIGSLTFSQSDNGRPMLEVNHMSKLSPQPSLSMSLGAPSATASFAQPFTREHVDGIEQSSTPSSFQQAQKPRPILPRPQKPVVPTSPDTSKNVRVARPPAEGRGKNQLLPRYWPRITDQELQKLSGALNSTIVPLFEKVLSASDAGRIGRLVLPKACAEAYFPPISQSEGLPLRIQDVKGNEWTFQFRFWPNNNSRMYVLEGVTPCIQSMRLQAGDTVTFSRRDPGNKLVIGFRKASQSANMQGHQTSILPNGNPWPTSFSSGVENVATGNGDSSIFLMNNGSKDTHLNSPSDQLSEWEMYMQKNENNGHRTSEDSLQPVSNSEKKRTRNIGPKSKRLHMHSEDVMELRLTWEEAQELLRPPPSVSPNIVTIEEHEFEEYDEPPVFGKRTIFTAGSSKQEQWAQCDNCSKWRKLPVDVLLPPRWTCQENSWDSSRCLCSAPEEIIPKQLDNLLSSFVSLKGLKKRRKITEKDAEEHEPSGLDALASAAILGDKVSNSGEQSVAATTKHPRHRPGCSCIVCIQPPSGKGKHKSSCTCNVCMTVKRRFKTMMQRKNQKRQLEREAQISQMENDNYKEESELNGTTSGEAALHMNHSPESSQRDNNHKDESEVNGTTSGDAALHMYHSSENGASSSQSRTQADATESSSARQIDLNCEPFALLKNRTLPDLLKLAKAAAAARPSEKYANESCLRNMTSDEQAGIASLSSTPQANGDNERCLLNEASLSSAAWTSASVGDKVCREPDLD